MTTRVYTYVKTAAPSSSDDSAAGYSVGDNWNDTTNDKNYKAIDLSVGAAIWKRIDNVYKYPLALGTIATSNDPADTTTYYWGHPWAGAWGTSAVAFPVHVPIAGTIIAANVFMRVGTVGSNHPSTLSIRLNDTTDTALTATVDLSSNYSEQVTGLSIAVAADDALQCKWLTPTWTTNPLDVYITVQLVVEV